MSSFAVDGKQLYFEHHRGTKAPVVLIHGWAATTRSWNTVLLALVGAGHEVVMLDQRGCGKSDNDFDDFSIDALGNDVVALVNELSLDRPVVNGWSLGGAVAADAAAKLGDNLRGLVLTGGATPRYTATTDWPYGGSLEDVEGVLGAAALAPAPTFRGVAEAVCATDPGPQVIAHIWEQFMEAGPRTAESLRDLANIDQRDILGKIAAPVQLMIGVQDAFVPVDGVRASVELYKDARIVEFESSGHATFLEEAEKYNAALLGFLEGLG